MRELFDYEHLYDEVDYMDVISNMLGVQSMTRNNDN